MDNNNVNALKWKIIFRSLPVLGFMLLAAGAGHMVYIGRPYIPDIVALALGILLFLTLFIRAEVANIKYYANVFTYSLFVFIFCAVGYMFARSRSSMQWDFTKSKFFSLSDQSTKVVKNLKKEVEVAVFYQDAKSHFREIEELYSKAGGKLKWTFVDPRREPLVANKYGDNIRNGTIVLKAGAKTKRLSFDDLGSNLENVLTNAIIEVSRDKVLKVYFLTGHGEMALENTAAKNRQRRQITEEESTLATFKKRLTDQGTLAESLNLTQRSFIPEDAAALVIAGPQGDLQPGEIQALKKYLDGEGKLFVTLDVPQTQLGQGSPQSNLKKFLSDFGVDVEDKVIMDLVGNQLVGSPVHPIIAWLNPEQVITSEYAQRSMLFPLQAARPVRINQNATGYKATELLKTSPESWAEDLKVLQTGQVAPPAQREAQPVGIAVTVAPPPAQPGQPMPAEPKSGMRMVVFGTSDMIGDQAQSANQTAVALMKSSINWLTQQEDLIAVPPRQIEGTPLVLDQGQFRMIIILAILLLPGLLFFGGLSYTMSRARR